MMKTSPSRMKHTTARLTAAFAALLLTLFTTAHIAADSMLIARDWQNTPQGEVLTLTFDQAPIPAYDEAYNESSLEARLTFWNSVCQLPQVLRQMAPTSELVNDIQIRPILFGEEKGVQVIITFDTAADYVVDRQGAALKVQFAKASLIGKGDQAISLDAGPAEADPLQAALEGLVSFEQPRKQLAQDDTMDSDLPILDDSADSDLPPLEDFSAEIESDDSDLPDMNAILSEAFEVPAEDQQAFLPPVGDANLKYSDIFGDESAILPDETWNKSIDTLKFRETPLQDALRLIAARSGLNILFNADDVSGEITTELTDVPLGAALEAILRVNDLAAVRQEGNIVRIVPRNEVYSEEIELAIKSRPLNWVQAGTMAAILKDFVTDEGELVAAGDANALVVKDSPANLAKLMELIDRLDVPEKQVTIKVMAIDLNVTMAREQGVSWNLARPDEDAINQVGTRDFNGNPPGSTQLDELFGPFIQTREGSEPPSEMMAGTIAAIGQAVPTPVGFAGLSPIKVDQVGVRNPIAGTPNIAWEYGTDVTILGNRFSLETAVQALENQNILSVLASPEVTTLNNILAEIRIVRKQPFFETTQNPGSSTVSTTVKFEDIGLTVRTVPNITNNNYVRMAVTTDQQIFVGTRTDPATGALGLITDERVFNSNVVVKDENTVVLGGLRSMDVQSGEQGAPWFRRAPVLGWLFKSTNRATDKKELMLFVTPKILKDPRLSEFEERRLGELDMMWSLPDYFFDDDTVVPEDFYRDY
jgi:type IV pilus secretin PilQ/predicted competence protein